MLCREEYNASAARCFDIFFVSSICIRTRSRIFETSESGDTTCTSSSSSFSTSYSGEVRDSMTGVYSTSVDKHTLDEAPMAYKPMENIMKHIGETVEVEKRMKPIYNFKVAE
ncbi:RtcB family protein [Synergistaceae bacterium OttesenSCG-928-I11]|nr:RtcB family protein [Synergistaceae bacterium OttesenSCG-928-I11]